MAASKQLKGIVAAEPEPIELDWSVTALVIEKARRMGLCPAAVW